MSFYSKNENFIRIKFYSDMKGMSLEQKIFYYNSYLRKDTIRRLKEYLKSLGEELENEDLNIEDLDLFTKSQNEFQNKIKFYQEIIDLLKDFEFESILFSIYFEESSKELLFALGEELIKNRPDDFHDNFLILDSLNKNRDLTKLILTEHLNLTSNDWLEESVNRNPIIKKLIEWIGLKIIENDTESDIKLVLFHYAKFWKTKYSNPYNEIKGIILFNDLITTLKKELQNMKIDLKNNLNELFFYLDSLFYHIDLPPFLENEMTSRKSKTQGYEIKKNEFNLLLEESSKYLINYDKLTNQELYDRYFDSNETIQKKIFEIIKTRFSNNYKCNENEIEYFIENFLSKNNDSQQLIKYFIKINYLFNHFI